MRPASDTPQPPPPFDSLPVTGLLLAGGQGTRMGGVDKGLQRLGGRPLAAWVLDRLAPQVAEVLISANRHPAEYAALGHPVLADRLAGFAGPLAGLQAGLAAARHDLVAVAPCDSPHLPTDLVSRLFFGLTAAGADAAIVRAGGRVHPVFCLVRRSLAPRLNAALQQGERRFYGWLSTLALTEVKFDDCPQAFANLNTLADLAGSALPAGAQKR